MDTQKELKRDRQPARTPAPDTGAPACAHPPHRLYCGHARDEQLRVILWIACCECGAVLQGGAEAQP